jgi:hypothetical protein
MLQQQNAHKVHDIIAYARSAGVSMQIIELVGTDANSGLGQKVPSAGITAWLRTIATDEQVITSGTGQGKRVFTVDQVTIEMIDASLGRHHTGQCRICPARDRCTEGFWAVHDLPNDTAASVIAPFTSYLAVPDLTVYLHTSPRELTRRMPAKPDQTRSDHDLLADPSCSSDARTTTTR